MPITIDERSLSLHEAVIGANLTLLLCDDTDSWDAARIADLTARYPGLLRVQHLTRRGASGVLVDSTGDALSRLRVRSAAQYLIRPDGHVAFRCGGRDLGAVEAYLAEWFPAMSAEP